MNKKLHNRFQILDIARGIAIVLMVYFHLFFDLATFHFVENDFYNDPYWLHLRTIIVSLFLVIVGISLTISRLGSFNLKRYLYRLGQLLFFSLLITFVSYLLYSDRMIIIGILHFIFLASILGLLFLRFYYLNLTIGIAVIILGNQFEHPFFNQGWIHWLGLMTHAPQTEDYVPIIPWFGVVLVGMFIGHTIYRNESLKTVFSLRWNNQFAHALEYLGKHSLLIYVIHQPILYGSIWGIFLLTK